MNWILIVSLVAAGFLLIWYRGKLLAAIGRLFQDNGRAFVALLISFVAASVLIVLFQPQFFQFLFSSVGPTGPDRRVAETKADMVELALVPNINPNSWTSPAAKAAVDNVASEYQLATAKNKAGMSQADAEQACYLPKGHPDRALWDNAGLDPCKSSVPAGWQVTKRDAGEISKNAGDEIRKIDFTATDKELSRPWGQAPADADPWLRQIYNLPKGIPVMVGLTLLALLLVMTLRALFARGTT